MEFNPKINRKIEMPQTTSEKQNLSDTTNKEIKEESIFQPVYGYQIEFKPKINNKLPEDKISDLLKEKTPDEPLYACQIRIGEPVDEFPGTEPLYAYKFIDGEPVDEFPGTMPLYAYVDVLPINQETTPSFGSLNKITDKEVDPDPKIKAKNEVDPEPKIKAKKIPLELIKSLLERLNNKNKDD